MREHERLLDETKQLRSICYEIGQSSVFNKLVTDKTTQQSHCLIHRMKLAKQILITDFTESHWFSCLSCDRHNRHVQQSILLDEASKSL